MLKKSILKMLMLASIISLFLTSSCFTAEGILTENSSQIDRKITPSSDDIEYYALVVGVEVYQDKNFSEKMLEHADKIDDGAKKMYDLLNRSENFKEENTKMILNEQATSQKIEDNITSWLDDKEDENDIVLIYITGHAWKMPLSKIRKGNAYLFSYDVSTSKYSENAITDIELDSWVDTLESKHIVVIFDTCFSGRMLAMRQQHRTILTAGGRLFLCPVDEHDSLGGGIFSHFLIQGFNGVADINNDGWVTAKEAFRYARRPVLHFSLWAHFPYLIKYPDFLYFSGPQIPFIYDRHIGNIPLIKYKLD